MGVYEIEKKNDHTKSTYLCLCLCLSVCVCLCLCLSVSVSISMYMFLSPYLSMSLSFSLSLYIYIHIHVNIFTYSHILSIFLGTLLSYTRFKLYNFIRLRLFPFLITVVLIPSTKSILIIPILMHSGFDTVQYVMYNMHSGMFCFALDVWQFLKYQYKLFIDILQIQFMQKSVDMISRYLR